MAGNDSTRPAERLRADFLLLTQTNHDYALDWQPTHGMDSKCLAQVPFKFSINISLSDESIKEFISSSCGGRKYDSQLRACSANNKRIAGNIIYCQCGDCNVHRSEEHTSELQSQ